MTFGTLAIKRPVAILMLMAFVLLLGLVSLTNLQMDLLPKISPPILGVVTRLPNAAPNEVATLITEPLEMVVGTTSGLKKISSRSAEGTSIIILEFNWGINLDAVREEIKDRLEFLQLPEDASKPMIVKFDPTRMPVLQITVTGEKTLREIQRYVEKEVVPKLDSIPGVASVEVTGAPEKEINFIIDEEKLQKYGVNPKTLAGLINLNNLNLPAHKIEKDNKIFPIRVIGQFKNLNQMENIIVGMEFGDELTPVYLKDVVQIEEIYTPLESLSRTNGLDGINITIQREGDSNLVQVTQRVLEKIDKMERGGEYNFTVTLNQGEIVQKSINGIVQNLVIGAFLALIILLVFLRSILSTLVVTISIPFSLIATFILMYFTGLTLNLMTLGGLALGVGMLVDNSIVVIENIYRHLQQGKDLSEATKNGVDEVAMAITASTFTTMVVFLPVVFVGGLTGELFGELALTVSFSLLASLLVALTVIPMLSFLLLKYQRKIPKFRVGGLYKVLLSYPMAYKGITLLLTVVVFILALSQYPKIGREFIPEIDEGSFIINLTMEEGTNLDLTNEEARKIEKMLEGYEEIEVISTRVGSKGGITGAPRTDRAEISVLLKERGSTKEFISKFRETLTDINGTVSFTQQNEFRDMMGSSELQLILHGPDLEGVQKVTRDILIALEKVENLEDIRSNIEGVKPEAQILIDRNKSALYHLTTAGIAQNIKTQLAGERIGYLFEDGKRVEIKLIYNKEKEERDSNNLKNLQLTTPIGGRVSLGEVAEIRYAYGPRTIYREDGRVTSIIQGKITKGDLGTIQKEVDKVISELNLPQGYSTSYGGASQLMEEGFQGLSLAFILAFFLVYMIMAAQFESLLNPFIIIFTIPFAGIGVIGGLLLTGKALGITAFIGIIVLTGIVVNNGIVLVDYINKLRQQGLKKEEAIIKGGCVRLRPILMTALTTILALIPLALGLGDGGEMQGPMAIVVIGGLFISTLLTLFVLPVIYYFLSAKD
ncbi:hydrophobic/amphiphilic exporter-1, HAE1 family [Anaerobranca californiensis DSM 14826]|jgi:HAE1 family hydrophobic/amphiphilic exporter-1|uniref:Hydrophobic/amphiphilic exporter-1, HAE1 family n=1 Tax=Anaerobranca californiensis DSM 14826 TaxID=1120989 RepID=A0A1M6LBR7_9FIRM|nr:efflux RND transporter permease subunit [Anaerobranca californiensis]SHJ68604.1 hydrophobic/amphiphilic exporter-1, HAE1 family [Anaerobranca californiensis DSM 14826]